ncbi:LysR substrate-binding domain-containing protein [Dokdonella sp.]|uniref:LysR substrate-binding domain-containing protein n=1 Tax=Dokdonella sp. TaxID=2291710 RepID=UPI0026157EE1|nr:LysR substrate-binding domain-containing protein [Dokdonella sp.]
MERPPLNALQVFVTAARAENMTRAAEQLHLTVSALSHQVRLLEQRLGVTLFLRGPRGLKPTPEGAMLLQRVGPHLDAIDAALQPLRARRDCTLRISALPSLASSWLVPRLPRFVARHPDFEFNLDSSVERVGFADGRFDGALRYGPGTWDDVVAELLFEEWLTPVASPSLLAGRAPPRLERLGEWPLLCPDDPWPRWFEQFGGSEPQRYVATFSDSDTLMRATVEGMGVSLGRATLMRPLVESGRLVVLFPVRMRARYAHYLVYPERSRRHRGFVAFRDWLHAEALAFREAGLDDWPARALAEDTNGKRARAGGSRGRRR